LPTFLKRILKEITMQLPLPDDSQLIDRLGNNDVSAFEAIYGRYWKPLFDFAWAKTHDTDTAEEIVQDLFVTLWEKRNLLQIRSLRAYLFAAVRNRIIDHFKNNIFTELDATDSAGEPDYPLFLDELEAAMQNAVGQLPEKTRRVFVLSRFEGNTIRQIALQLKMPERTVEYHITQALRSLKMLLKEFIVLLVATLLTGNF
jgi:RNA polymerase sigma-70 factor (family 1)